MKNKVFIGPCEIAGQYRNIALLLIKSGVKCDYYTFYPHRFNYGCDIGESKLPSLMRALNKKGKESFIFIRLLYLFFFEILRLLFFLRALIVYDYFYFGFGLSLLRNNWDLPILYFFKKRVLMNLSHGSDMTPDYLDGALMNEQHLMPSINKTVRMTRSKKKKVQFLEKWCSCIIGSPLSSSFLASKPFVDIIKLGRVCQAQFNSKANVKTIPKKTSKGKPLSKSNPFRIVHIPSHSPGKGSNDIRDVVIQLKSNVANIEYVELKNLSNDEVLLELSNADLLIDQMYSDLPLSGLGMEALILGTPVIVSGYGLRSIQDFYPQDYYPPSICCHPKDLLNVLYEIVEPDFTILKAYKAKIKKFFEDAWSIELITSRYTNLILGQDVPKSLFHVPSEIIYLYGYGLSETKVKLQIKNVIDNFGVSGLSLNHRSDLIDAFLKLAEEK